MPWLNAVFEGGMLLVGGMFRRERILSPAGVVALTTGVCRPASATRGTRWAGSTLRTRGCGPSRTTAARPTWQRSRSSHQSPRDAVVVLANAQSIPYEVLGKIDMIGQGTLAQMLGRQADGTLERFYPIVDAVLLVILILMVRGHVRLARRVRDRERPAAPGRIRRAGRDGVPRVSDLRRPAPAAGSSADVPRGALARRHPHRYRSCRRHPDRRAPERRWPASRGMVADERSAVSGGCFGGFLGADRGLGLRTMTDPRGRTLADRHPDAADLLVSAAFGVVVFLGTILQRGNGPDALLAATSLGIGVCAVVLWSTRRRRDRVGRAAAALLEQRLSIARELHDVVAHHVSLIGIEAAAARRTLERSPARRPRP